jgi:hypothetical protein
MPKLLMSVVIETSPLPPVTVMTSEVFPKGGDPSEVFFELPEWAMPVTYFVGRNGTGKSRTAKLVAQRLGGRLLSTDRLAGVMSFQSYGWTSVPAPQNNRGIPLRDQERTQARGFSQNEGSAIDDMYALREQPEVWLRVAAFLRRALNRVIDLRETAGFLDPYVTVGGVEYSLLRDEGHGLRELVILLTAAYRRDWRLLVVDEPELHLHPAMVRMWMSVLERECKSPSRRAIVVTHEPDLLKPKDASDLRAIRLFVQGRPVCSMADHVLPIQEAKVSASLQHNPELVGQLMFSPRPVLVEGVDDVSALSVTLSRTQPPEVVAQTDLVECGGSGGVALWYEICKRMGIDIRAVGDLDSCFAVEVQRAMDEVPEVIDRYRSELMIEPPRTSSVLQPLYRPMEEAAVAADPKARARWLARDVPAHTGWESRRDRLLQIWRDAGLWLHPQGTLEDVLGISVKSRDAAQAAARTPGAIDEVANWCAYELDPIGDVEALLNVAVERIAHAIMEALRINPAARFNVPIGGSAVTDARLVSVDPVGDGVHRLMVKEPAEFRGYWLDFSRETPSSQLVLHRPGGPPAAADA